jgi:hypothetical protein
MGIETMFSDLSPQVGALRLIGERLRSLGYSAPWYPDEDHWLTIGGGMLNIKLVVEGPVLKMFVGKVVIKQFEFNPFSPKCNPQDIVDTVIVLKTKIGDLEKTLREAIE